MNKKQKCYKWIRDLREDKDLTQIEVAEKLGFHTTQYQRYERAETTIPADIIVDIAKLYEVSTDYILGLTNNPEPNYKIKNQININGRNQIKKIEMKWGNRMEKIENIIEQKWSTDYNYKYTQKIEENKIKLTLEIEVKKDCNKTDKIKEDIKNGVILSNKELLRKL